MKYEQALDQKGLKFEQLSNSLQKKINKIKEYDEKFNEIKQTDDGSVTEEDIFSYNEGLKILDEEASKAILKFNLENYELQKERLISTRKKIRKNDEPKEDIEEVQVVIQEDKDEVVIKEQPKLENRIEQLKKEVSIQPENFVADEYDYEEGEEEVQEVVEDVDFDKKQNIKQKKGTSTSLIIMGIGAFILTWGAVNFFKGRK